MTEVKPWEPVEVVWQTDNPSSVYALPVSPESVDVEIAHMTGDWFPTFKLANSQRVIVRALSEERKAARAMCREAAEMSMLDRVYEWRDGRELWVSQ